MLKWTVNKPIASTNITTTTTSANTMSIFVDHEPTAAAAAAPTAAAHQRRSLSAALQPARSKPAASAARKSLGSAVATRKLMRSQNKENRTMVSPHAANLLMRNSPSTSTPNQFKADFAFREIGNLTPTLNSSGAAAATTPLRKAFLPPSPSPTRSDGGRKQPAAMPAQQRLFAATLPTLNVEYSPACNVQRPLASAAAAASPLPVRGITVQSSIFGASARYFGNDRTAVPAKKLCLAQPPPPATTATVATPPELQPLAFQLSKLRFSTISLPQCVAADEDDANVSSKSLDDTALDRMIDEILESTRKVRKCPARKCPVTTSTDKSTVATEESSAAESSGDSSSDDDVAERTIISVNGQQEREVRTPDSTSVAAENAASAAVAAAATPTVDAGEQCALRRQRVVRRKHTAKGKKCPTATTTTATSTTPEPQPHDVIDLLAQMSTPVPQHPATAPAPHQSTSAEQTRRCLRYPDSPDSMEDTMEKRGSVASATGSTHSSKSSSSSSSGAMLFGTLDVTVAVVAHQVHVHVLRCNDLQRSNGAAINAYVKVALLAATAAPASDTGFQRTAVHRNSAAPVFEHRFVFDSSPESAPPQRVQLSVWHRDREYKRSEFLGCMSFPILGATPVVASGTYRLQSQSSLTHPTLPVLLQPSPTHADAHGRAAAEDSTDSSVAYLHRSTAAAAANGAAAISLSKKALYQREADELLYLRYLQLNAGTTDAAGRTASTLSKRLCASSAAPAAGFGFTVVWTHPPRVDRVEAGKPADRAGVRPGDFLCFVGEHNVVTMPEVDVLNLIRAQGERLEIEVFRKETAPAAAVVTMKRPSSEFDASAVSFGTRPKVARVEFSADVGRGVIV